MITLLYNFYFPLLNQESKTITNINKNSKTKRLKTIKTKQKADIHNKAYFPKINSIFSTKTILNFIYLIMFYMFNNKHSSLHNVKN